MALLGFDAVGKLALGQLPTVPAQTPQTKFSFGYNFSQPQYTRKVPQEGAIQFRILRPDAATPKELVFTRFSEPDLSKKTSVQTHTSPVFRTLRPTAATTGPLVFTKFSEPSFPKVIPQSNTNSSFFVAPVTTPVVTGGDFAKFDLVKSRATTQPGFTNAPIAPRTQPYVFSKFSEPSKTTFKNSDVSNAPVVPVAPTVQPYVFGNSIDLLPKKQPQTGFSNAPIFVPDAVVFQPYVFTDYADFLSSKKPQQGFTNAPLFTAQQPYVFTSFSQPSPKIVPQSDKLFVGDRGPAQTPTWSTFPQFKELLTKKPQQDPSIGFIGDLGPAQTPSRLAFADFEGISSRRPLEGYITSTSPPAVQNYVFSRFDQPVYKRIIHPDQSFVNFPVVAATVQPYVFSAFGQPQVKRLVLDDKSFVNFPVVIAAAQPYIFSDFGQPQQTKRPVVDNRSFVNFPVVVAQQQPYVFGQFDQPQVKRPLLGDFRNNTPEYVQAVVQNYSFGLFSQPLLVKPRVDGFTNTPDFIAVQPYVFGQFDQPRQLIRVVPGFTNNQTFIAPQSYVFSRFEQPSIKRTLQIDSVQFVENTPTVVVLTPDFSYSDFGLPFYVKQSGISFTNSPLQPIIAPDNSAPFSGFTSFVIQLPGQYHIEQHPGVVYEILVPDVLVEDVIAGKRWQVQATRKHPKAIPVVSSNIAEVTFDKDSNELNVTFNNGKVYNYSNVDSKKAKGLVRAKSSGKYLHNNIKGKYFTTRIK